MVPRGPPLQLRTADALPVSAFARTEWGPRDSLYEAVSKGIYAAGMPCGKETLAAPCSACGHSSFARLLLHGSRFLWESKCKFSIACPGCQGFPSFPACPEIAKLCKIATQMHFRIHKRCAMKKHLITSFHKTQLISNHMLISDNSGNTIQVCCSMLSLGAGASTGTPSRVRISSKSNRSFAGTTNCHQ